MFEECCGLKGDTVLYVRVRGFRTTKPETYICHN